MLGAIHLQPFEEIGLKIGFLVFIIKFNSAYKINRFDPWFKDITMVLAWYKAVSRNQNN